LVSSYLLARRRAGLWYHLDEEDNDPATFFYYLGTAAPVGRHQLPIFTAEYKRGLPVFTRRFFRELTARIRGRFLLVLDNYHVLAEDAALHNVLRHALDEISNGGRIVVISRVGLPAPLTRHRLYQRIAILGWDELRFTPAETKKLARISAPGRWSDAAVESLHARTQGWSAGIVLLAKALTTAPRTVERIDAVSADVLFAYFADEILGPADARTRHVLLTTTLLPYVTASMASELSSDPKAGGVLMQLHVQNCFTNRRGEAEAVFEYHPLIRAFLLKGTAEAYSIAQLVDLRRRAARIAEAAGLPDTAVSLFREAEDWASIAALISRRAPELLAQGRSETVERWLNIIPTPMLDVSPWLLYWRGVCWLAWRHVESQRDLERALALFRTQKDVTGSFLSWATLVIAVQGESRLAALDQWLLVHRDLECEFPTYPSDHIESRVAAAMLAALHTRKPAHPDGNRWAARAMELARCDPDKSFQGITAFNCVFYYFQRGQPLLALSVVEEVRPLMRAADVTPAAAVNAGLSVVWYEVLAALPSWRQTVAEVLTLARSTGMFSTVRLAVLAGGIFGALTEGDRTTALAWTNEFAPDVASLGPGYQGWHFYWIVRLALERGDIDEATFYRPRMRELGVAGGAHIWNLEAVLLSALVFAQSQERDDARAELQVARQLANDMDSPYASFMVSLIDAHVAFDAGDRGDGLRALKQAIDLGRAHEFWNVFTWEPRRMATLCAEALEAGIHSDYVLALVRRRGLTRYPPASYLERWPWPIKVFVSGCFEIVRDGQQLEFAHKVQRKPLELLQALIAFGGHRVAEHRLLDVLWPDAAGDHGDLALTTTIHRLRRLLGAKEAIVRQSAELSLNTEICWSDLIAIQRLLDRAEAVREPRPNEIVDLVDRILTLHRGPFLPDVGEPWGAAVRDTIRRRVLTQITRAAIEHESQGRDLEAISTLERALRIEPCSEDISRRLMAYYAAAGRHADLESVYERLQEALVDQLGIAPSSETRSLLQHLRDRA
jgi:DNA-binding SARP family transcriptional activator